MKTLSISISVLAIAVSVLAFVIATQAFGDDEPTISVASIEADWSDEIRAQLGTGQTVDDLDCVEADERRFLCHTIARDLDTTARVTVEIACDKSGDCASRLLDTKVVR